MKRVLVVGDVISDVYHECTFKKMCPDAPDVAAVVMSTRTVVPGGAANVALNLASLSPGTQVDLIGAISMEMWGEIRRLSSGRICARGAIGHDLVKERFLMIGGGMLLRVDNSSSVPSSIATVVTQLLRDYLSEFTPDLILMSDYAGGSLDDDGLDLLLRHRERLLVDTKRVDLSRFSGTSLLKVNAAEERAILSSGESAPERYFGSMVVTRGTDGADLIISAPIGPTRSITHRVHVDSHRVPVVDVCGCGDTFLAGLAASLLRNSDVYTAVQFANAAAATVVTEKRTAIADLDRALELLNWKDRT